MALTGKLKKINRKDALLRFPRFPQSKAAINHYFFPPVYKGYLLAHDSKSLRGHATKLADALGTLIVNMQYEELLFLGDSDTAWLRQRNEYPPVKKALQYFIENKTGQRFNGAFMIPGSRLPEFIPHLFWMVRCNAGLPIIHFSDLGQQVIGSICQYGNVHFYTLDKTADNRFRVALSKTAFKTLAPGAQCYDQFSVTGALAGRRASR